MQHADDEVGDREPRGFVRECVRDGERHEEASEHRGEDEEARRDVLDVDRVGQPRVRRPRPPHEREDERGAREAGGARVLEDEGRDLGEREDEDEVEEELDVAGALLLLGGCRLDDRRLRGAIAPRTPRTRRGRSAARAPRGRARPRSGRGAPARARAFSRAACRSPCRAPPPDPRSPARLGARSRRCRRSPSGAR